MSNLSKIKKDIIIRSNFFLSESLYLVYKSFLHDSNYPTYFRYFLYMRFINYIYNKNIFLTRIRNRCIFSGRSRGVFRKFKMSRFVIRSFSYNSDLINVSQRYW